MKEINRWGISAGLVALVGMAVFAASCSDDKKGATGVGGAAGTGGTTSDTGGANAGGEVATGGNTSTSTQATGGGNADSGAPVLGCTDANTDLARSDGLIADFTGTGADAGIQVIGGVTTYPNSDARPDAVISGGALHITQDADQTSAAQYVGTVIYFNDCVDASAFKGVEFTISGTMSGCTMQYSTNHSAANDMTTDPKGTCDEGPGNCYSPQKAVTVTDTETTVQVAWTGATGGNPAIAVDPSKLTGVQWQLTIPSGTGTCTADITIKNVKFYN